MVPGLLGAVFLAASGAAASAPGKGRPETRDRNRRAVERILRPPLGLPPVPVPADNPATAAKIRLGRKLFLDRRLSRNGTQSCAMCHVPEQGFTLNEVRTAVGLEGKTLPRNAPTLLNAAYAAPFFHDGREPDLDLQAFDVFVHPDEMGAPSLGAVVARVRALDEYGPLFQSAFDAHPGVERIGKAIGTYVRSLVCADSPFDRWRFGERPESVSEAARRGFRLFSGRAGCTTCHPAGADAALFSDGDFHDTGVARRTAELESRRHATVRVRLAPGLFGEMPREAVESVGRPRSTDPGRYAITQDPADRWRFKTPSLRNVALTAPYMHDGSLSTLRDVLDFYDAGGHPHEGQDPAIRPLGLAPGEVDDLVAFLESLTCTGLHELVEDVRSERVGNPARAGGHRGPPPPR